MRVPEFFYFILKNFQPLSVVDFG